MAFEGEADDTFAPLTLKEPPGSPYFRFEALGTRRKTLKTEETTTTMPKTSSTADMGIRSCPRLYTLCCHASHLRSPGDLRRAPPDSDGKGGCENLPTSSKIPGSRRRRTALGEGRVLAVCYSVQGRFLGSCRSQSAGLRGGL